MKIHSDQIQRYGGSDGIRDMALLQSALAMPEAGFGGDYLHRTLFEMAAAYLFHIVQNHPFVDGNKRTGAVCAFVFLFINNWSLKAPEKEFEDLVRSVAQGKILKPAIGQFLEKNSRSV